MIRNLVLTRLKPDADAYRGYDRDPEHNRLREEMAPFVLEHARAQIEMPDADV